MIHASQLLPSRCVTFSVLSASAPIREPVPQRAEDFGVVYEDNYRLLVGTAIGRFHIAEVDAQGLAHEVFLAFFLKADEILNSRAWLVSAICNASKNYLRRRARLVPLSEDFGEAGDPRQARAAEALPDQMVAREAFSCVTAKCQIALRLRYLEGYTIPEVAAELNTTARYAAKLVSRCLRQAQDRYTRKGDTDARA